MTTSIDIEAIAARWADYPASQAKRDIDALLAEVSQLRFQLDDVKQRFEDHLREPHPVVFKLGDRAAEAFAREGRR